MGRVDLIGEHPFADPWLNHLWSLRGTIAGTLLDIEITMPQFDWEKYLGTNPLDAAKPTGVPLR